MSSGSSHIKVWEDPAPEEVGETPMDFLRRLDGPAWIRVPGRDRTRTRALATLLHGNEPSGVRALHQYLRAGRRPAVNLVCIVGAVQAALREPGFAHRALPGRRDLNRCFRPPFEEGEGLVAENFLQLLHEARPECLVDIHNTSGSGPAFAVSVIRDRQHLNLASLFTRRMVITDLRLGALMELSERQCPAVTIECGGAMDAASTGVAMRGLERFADMASSWGQDWSREPVEILENPLRVELLKGCQIAFSSAPMPGFDLTLRQDIESLNLRPLPAGERLGWLGARGMEALQVSGSHGPLRPEDYFHVDGDAGLRTAARLRLSMATTVPSIAISDCLFYLFDSQKIVT